MRAVARRSSVRRLSASPSASGNCCKGPTIGRQTFGVMSFTVVDDRIVAIESLNDPHRLRELDLSAIA